MDICISAHEAGSGTEERVNSEEDRKSALVDVSQSLSLARCLCDG